LGPGSQLSSSIQVSDGPVNIFQCGSGIWGQYEDISASLGDGPAFTCGNHSNLTSYPDLTDFEYTGPTWINPETGEMEPDPRFLAKDPDGIEEGDPDDIGGGDESIPPRTWEYMSYMAGQYLFPPSDTSLPTGGDILPIKEVNKKINALITQELETEFPSITTIVTLYFIQVFINFNRDRMDQVHVVEGTATEIGNPSIKAVFDIPDDVVISLRPNERVISGPDPSGRVERTLPVSSVDIKAK